MDPHLATVIFTTLAVVAGFGTFAAFWILGDKALPGA